MRQSDIFSIIIIATVGTLAAFFGVNALLGDPSMNSATFTTINPISASLVEPDPELFNEDAINPTVEVYVGTCEDIDKNGILDREELIACNELEGDNNTVIEETEVKTVEDEEDDDAEE